MGNPDPSTLAHPASEHQRAPGCQPRTRHDTVGGHAATWKPGMTHVEAVVARSPSSQPGGPTPGQRVGSYEVIRPLGRGGMGQVYLARDLTLGRRVAMKFLRDDADQSLARRFVVEARATARCVHENIVVIHEVSSWNGLPYMVLEYLEGQTLREVMHAAPLTVPHALALLTPVVQALRCAHDAGIIHRDLKPDNIFVTRQGAVKVLDFGIAALLHAQDDGAQRDQATLAQVDRGRIFGTGPFMAPEQWERGPVDGRADLFSFGVIAHHALAGHHPAGRIDPARLEGVTRDVTTPFRSLSHALPGVPDGVAQVIDRCLCKRAADRYQSAAELARALEELDPRTPVRRREDACPYPGLLGFTERDADRFFGRARDVQRALELLRTRAVVAILGPSGAGKSSFAHAGLVSFLRAEQAPWAVVPLRPGPRPLISLLAALRELPGLTISLDDEARLAFEPGRLGQWLRGWCRQRQARVVLLVDQAEETFTLCRDHDERRAFLAALLSAADDPGEPVRLVLTMRSDFLQEVAGVPELAEAVVLGTLLLAPLDRSSLRAAVEGPLTLAGYRFEEPALLDEIAASFDGAPHALPMLQAMALQLWGQRDRATRMIPRAALAAIGGVAGALARYADSVLAALGQDEQQLAHAMLLRLVTGRDTRVALPRAELEGLAGAAPLVVNALLEARLLVDRDDTATIELAHEVLITGWPRLADWLSTSHAERALRERIGNAATTWDAHRRAAELLWDGDALAHAEVLGRSAAPLLSGVERAFLAASVAHRDRRKRRRRLVLVAGVALIAAIAVASTSALALVHQAERAALLQAERATTEAARSAAAERALAEKVRVLEQTEAARARAAAEAAGRQREVAAQREVIEQREGDLRAALTEARALLGERDASLRAATQLRHELEGALARERKNLARERERADALARRQAKIIGDLPP